MKTNNELVNKMMKLIDKTNIDISIYNSTKNEQLKARTEQAINYNKKIIQSLCLLINNEQIEYTILSI